MDNQDMETINDKLTRLGDFLEDLYHNFDEQSIDNERGERSYRNKYTKYTKIDRHHYRYRNLIDFKF